MLVLIKSGAVFVSPTNKKKGLVWGNQLTVV